MITILSREVQLTFPADAQIGARLMLVDLETGEELVATEMRRVEPGETVTAAWTRPKGEAR